MDLTDLCVCCDEPLPERGVTHCDVCAELRSDGETPDILTALGLSIARFVRRAEVERLVERVRLGGNMGHAAYCWLRVNGSECDCGYDGTQAALSRLASLAMEGES